MPRAKALQVGFFVVEPRVPHDTNRPPAFLPGQFPAQTVLEEIDVLDRSTGEYYMETSLLDKIVCFVHGPAALEQGRILGAYTKDEMTALMTEYKGELREIDLQDDEGVVDPTFVAFFPGAVAAVLRCSRKAPGPAAVANYISLYTDYECEFHPLPSGAQSVQARLQNPDPLMYKLVVKAKRAVFSRLGNSPTSVGRALFEAGRLSNSEAVALELTSGPADDWYRWWAEISPSLDELLEMVGDLEIAKIEVRGGGEDINLRRAFVTARVALPMEAGRITPYAGAEALHKAYAQSEAEIDAALTSWRELRR